MLVNVPLPVLNDYVLYWIHLEWSVRYLAIAGGDSYVSALAKERLEVSPGRLEGSPGRLEVSPGRLEGSPGRLEVSPGRLEVSPGRLEQWSGSAKQL